MGYDLFSSCNNIAHCKSLIFFMLLIGSEDSSICTGKKCSLVIHRQSPVYKLVQNPNLQAECSVELSVGCLQPGMYFPSETKLYIDGRPPGHLEKMI